ncbi:MAG: hypothetical protein NT062_39745 [Proteobacteria bacterium]|nr:hypothetical protein [Pseudomonadota bacterium]
MTLRRVQRGLEELYRIETGANVDDFVIDEAARDRAIAGAPNRRPREQLLVVEEQGEGGPSMSIALFVDRGALQNLDANDPSRRLGAHNLGDFLLAVEGVSHFIYTLMCARTERPVSQLELELQAEVDKFVTCLLVTDPTVRVAAELRQRLFGEPIYDDDLDGDEVDRYRVANDNAYRYTGFLQHAFVGARKIPEMLAELRQFYRRGLAAKLAACAA